MRYRVSVFETIIQVPAWDDQTLWTALREQPELAPHLPEGLRASSMRTCEDELHCLEFVGEPEQLQVLEAETGRELFSLQLIACWQCGSFEGCDINCPCKNLN